MSAVSPGVTMILVALAGGLGAAARLVADGAIARWTSRAPVPLGIVVVNIAGSFVLGVVTALVGGSLLSPQVGSIVGVGFCGGFTTFSTASLEAVRLWAEEGRGRATAYTTVTVFGAVLAVWVGLAVGAGL